MRASIRPSAPIASGLASAVARVDADDDVDLVVVDDHGEPVVSLEPADRLLDCLLRQGDLLAGHGARAVEHERQVDRRSLARRRSLVRAVRAPSISARMKRLLR